MQSDISGKKQKGQNHPIQKMVRLLAYEGNHGTNIKKISNNAFFKCRSLKMVNIKSVLLTKKTANKKAFKGVGKKMVIKVPKKVKKAYVKMFKGLKVK